MRAMVEAGYPLTAEALLLLPDEDRCELVRGAPRPRSLAGWLHGYVTLQIGSRLATHCEARRSGRGFAAGTGFVLGHEDDTVLAPDVSFVRADRRPERRRGFWQGPPDFAVEVVSPNDSWSQVDEKVGLWLEFGCPLLLVVDPERRVAFVHRPEGARVELGADDVFDAGDVVPGFRLALREVWAPAPDGE